MARSKKKGRDDDEREEDEEEEEEQEIEEASVARDFVLARVAVARNALQAGIDSLDEMTALFVNPDDDKNGKERTDLLDGAVEQVGIATRALEAAEEVLDDAGMDLGEPWDDE